jgi:alpha-D-ribose 1-methylphosphonate 5-triphosphate synthase subunit PhnH
MRLIRFLLLPLLVIGLFLPPLAMGAAHAAPTPALQVNPASAAPNGTFAVSGSGFEANQTLVLKLDSTTLSASVVTDGSGAFGPTTYTVPAGTTSGSHPISASSTGGQLLALSAIQVTAQSATLLLTPASGAPGARILAAGSGFTANEPVSIALGTTVLANTAANAQGQISASLTLPQRLAVGVNTLVATGSTSKVSANAVYTVSVPTLALSVTSGASGSSLTVGGHNFAANEAVRVSFAGSTVAQVNTDGAGSFSTTFAVPTGASGVVQVTTTGLSSAIAVNASFTRLGGPAVLTLAPVSGAPGLRVQASGSGFMANEPVTIVLGTTVLATTTANAQGQISVSLTLPQRLTAGVNTLVATGSSSKLIGSATYTVSAPTVALSATSGASGSNLTVVGHNFAANETVHVSFAGTAIAQVNTDSSGSFSTTFAVPAGTSGAVTVAATGVNSLVTANASFTRTGGIIRSNVNNIAAGGTLTLTGTGFGANEPIQISIPGAVLLNIHANAQGTFSTPLIIPASHAAGVVVISARGQTTGLVTTTKVTVIRANTIIRSNVNNVAAGGALTLMGSGFGANELIQISIPGAVLLNIHANAQGAFSTRLTIPATHAAGALEISARGQTTGLASTTHVTVIARTAEIIRSNVNNIAAGEALTLTGSGFGANEPIQISIPGAVLLNIHANAQGTFSTRLTIPVSQAGGALVISARGQTTGLATTTKVTVLPLPANTLTTKATTWYFAAGQTADGTSLSIAVLNSNNVAVQGTLTLFYGTGQTRAIPFSLAAQARGTYDIGRYVGAMPQVAIMVHANRPIAAARISSKHGNNYMASAGVSAPSRTWYMAEGYTGLSFTETLFLLNPGSGSARVHLTWPLGNGKAPIQHDVIVPAHTQVSVPVNTYVKHASHSTMISSDQPIVAARRIIFGNAQQGATLKPGLTRSSTTLYFAEGSTANGFEEYLTIFNPDRTRAAQVTAQFHDPQGHLLGTRTITVDPLSRGTIKVNTVAHSSSIATVLHSNLPIVAERALYFGAPNGNSAGGTVVFGRSAGATGWAFAGGDLRPGQVGFNLLYNPNPRPNDILITYHTPGGQLVHATFNVPANARVTVDLLRSVPGLPRDFHGVTMRSLSNLPFLAEQAIYNQHLTRGYAMAGAPAS